MRTNTATIALLALFLFVAVSGCQKAQQISLWDRHCSSCHDGKTKLNNKVVLDKEQLKTKYKTTKDFANACTASPSCMNIVKHDKKLFLSVGTEIGIGEAGR
jgi:hypothetical protein